MRLTAALICVALLLPAPAVLAADLEPGSIALDSPGDELAAKVRAEAPALAEGITSRPLHQGTATAEQAPATLRSTSLLLQLLGIIFGQDRVASWEQAPTSP